MTTPPMPTGASPGVLDGARPEDGRVESTRVDGVPDGGSRADGRAGSFGRGAGPWRKRWQRWVAGVRSSVSLNPLAIAELMRERRIARAMKRGGAAAVLDVDTTHRASAEAALDWLLRAQDATPDAGFSRGYSLAWNRAFRSRGWQPSYPETTGYIIPSLLFAAEYFGRAELRERALRAAYWEADLQLPSGAVLAGVVAAGPATPAVFNTGQVMFGWLAAWEVDGEERFAEATRRAGRFLVESLDADGIWRRGNSRYTVSGGTLYNARTAWALAEAGRRLGEPSFEDAARRALHAVAERQHANGWFPDCCISDTRIPLLHTLAYTTRGLFEGGRVLDDPVLFEAGTRAAHALAATVAGDGTMPGRYASDWSAAVPWSCLTGQAQMANNWTRLATITGDAGWRRPVEDVLRFLKRTQNRTSRDGGLRGGIKGSWPVSGRYGRFEVLNWATKFHLDALMRSDPGTGDTDASGIAPRHPLA